MQRWERATSQTPSGEAEIRNESELRLSSLLGDGGDISVQIVFRDSRVTGRGPSQTNDYFSV